MRDREARYEIEELESTINFEKRMRNNEWESNCKLHSQNTEIMTNMKKRLHKLERLVCLPCLDLNSNKTSLVHNMPIRDALQHLINHLDIVYLPDKFSSVKGVGNER